MSAFVDKLFDIDTLEAVLNPPHASLSHISIAETSYLDSYNNSFTTPYYAGVDSLASRYVSLPLLDSVCGRDASPDSVNWDELLNLLIAQFPNIGQDKDLIYSDRLTWRLGLRDYGNIGRPEVTNACELYAMTGWAGLFIIAFLEFLAGLFLLEALKAQLVAPALWIAVIPQMLIWMTVSTTALASVSYLIRGIPITILSVWLLVAVANGGFGRSHAALRRRESDAAPR
jgi:hypothetical protein